MRLDSRLAQIQIFPLMIAFSASMPHLWPQERMQFRHVTEFGNILMQHGFTAH